MPGVGDMKRPTCETCDYYQEGEQGIEIHGMFGGEVATVKRRDGSCQKYPAYLDKFKTDWCGEHQDFKRRYRFRPSDSEVK